MKEHTKSKKTGRIPLERTLLDGNGDSRFWDVVAGMFRLHCTVGEVAAVMACNPATLHKACLAKFEITPAVYRERCMQYGNAKLRRKQWEVAMGGDRPMLIWLGKQYLKQRDEKSLVHEVKEVEDMPTKDLMAALPKAIRVLGYDDELDFKGGPTQHELPGKDSQRKGNR